MRLLRNNHVITALLMSILLTAGSLLCPTHGIGPDSFGASADNTSTDEIILLLADGTTNEMLLQSIHTAPGTLELIESLDDYALCKITDGTSFSTVQAYLARLPIFTAVSANDSLFLTAESSDPAFTSQWALDNPGYYHSLAEDTPVYYYTGYDVDMNYPEARTLYQSKNVEPREVIVAVIDTGIDYMHPELTDSMWYNVAEIPDDGIDNDENGYIDDYYGWDFYNNDCTVCHYDSSDPAIQRANPNDSDDHGTHCAGIIAAAADNGLGITGIASEFGVKVMSLKTHGGVNGKSSTANTIKAIKYAIRMGAQICNISWGSGTYNAALEQVMRQAPMLFVTAAGNNATNNNSIPVYPACFDLPNVLSVTFIDCYGALCKAANFGITTVDLAAPGMDIYSTVVGGYTSMSGSSMAVPHVVGAACILYSLSEHIDPANIIALLTQTIKPLSSLDGMCAFPGIPDCLQLVLASDTLRPDTDAPVLSLSTKYDMEHLTITVDANDGLGSGICTQAYGVGTQDLAYFTRGLGGIVIENGSIVLNKAGVYTIYAMDYAGNEVITEYTLVDDIQAPAFTINTKLSFRRDRILLSGIVQDEQSGVNIMKYASGHWTQDDFKSAGIGRTLLTADGIFADIIIRSDVYTFYAADYRGNKSLVTVYADIIPAIDISLSEQTLLLKEGDIFPLIYLLTPADSTDDVRFHSSDPAICSVSTCGTITANRPGTAVITAQTPDGLTAACEVVVE